MGVAERCRGIWSEKSSGIIINTSHSVITLIAEMLSPDRRRYLDKSVFLSSIMVVYQLEVSLDGLAIVILYHKVVRQIYDMFVEIGVLGFSLDTEFLSGTSLRRTVLQIGLTVSVGYTVDHVQFTVQIAGNVMTIGQQYIKVTGDGAGTELAVQFTLGIGFQFLVDELDFVPG